MEQTLQQELDCENIVAPVFKVAVANEGERNRQASKTDGKQ